MILTEKFLTKSDLDSVERFADRLFAKVGIDVEFTRHFLDRVNDERNKKQITQAELIRLFKQTYSQHGKKIPKLGPDAEAVINDMRTDINMPFVLKWDKNTQEFDMVAKTVMRKKDFKTSNPKIAVESTGKKTFRDVRELKISKPSNPKGIERIKMPQIAEKDYPEYFKYMEGKGFTRKTAKVSVKALKPIQSEFGDMGILRSIEKLQKLKDLNKPIIVSRDMYVIDGNHRWLAALNTRRKEMPAIIFDGDHNAVMKATLAFPKVTFKAVEQK
jgi:hypothetical protein